MSKPIITAIAASLVIAAASGCAEKPCDAIPSTDNAERVHAVLDGGKLCKDDRGVASVDYPGKDVATIKSAYEAKLNGEGWETERTSESDKLPIVFFAKGDDKLMVTVGKSSERRVTFALVKYCPESGPIKESCTQMIDALGKEMAKN